MNYNESKENKALDVGLRMAGINTDPYMRDLIMKMSTAAKKLKGKMTIDDVVDIEVECCEIHGLDYETKNPIRHDNKKILIAKIVPNGYEYDSFDGWTKDPKDARDYETHALAEQIMASKKLKGVIILHYYA